MNQFETTLISSLDKFQKPFYLDWGFWSLIILSATLIVLAIYTCYTCKLYNEARKTNKYSLIPLIFVGFDTNSKKLIINTSASKNPAMNYKIMAMGQTHEGETVIELERGLIISTNNTYGIDLPFWDNRLKYMYTVEYEDILGNKYATEWIPDHTDGLKLKIFK